MQQYSSELSQKQAIIVGNKVDLMEGESSRTLGELREATGMPVHLVSAKHGHGMTELRKALSDLMPYNDIDYET